MRLSFILLLSLFFTQSVFSQTSSSALDMPEALSSNPLTQQEIAALAQRQNLLGFKENKGQMADENGALIPYVYYQVETPGLNIWLTNTGLTYQFFTIDKKYLTHEDGTPKLDHLGNQVKEKTVRWNRVDMILKNATILKDNIIHGDDITLGEESYYLGHCPDGVFHVKTYQKITIKNVYPGIDWVLYTSPEGGLKQDFVVHPMADPNQIKLIYEGNGTMDIQQNKLSFSNDLGNVSEGGLLCYEQGSKMEIVSAYQATRNNAPTYLSAGIALTDLEDARANASESVFSYEVGVELGDYDKSQVLIIDPQLVWGTLYGGSGADGPLSVDTDLNGNVFVAGYVVIGNFPTLNPGGGVYFQGTYTGVNEAFILKFDNTGVLLWATYYGGSSNDVFWSITTDLNGNVFVTGMTASSNFPNLNPGGGAYFQGAMAGSSEAIIVKFTNTGIRLWATYYAGSAYDVGNSIITDINGNVFVTGYALSTNLPTLNPGGGAYFQGGNAGGLDVFILKFNNAGVRLWVTYYGGSGTDSGQSITTDLNGNVFLTGYTESNNFPTLNPGGGAYFQATNGGDKDMFILKFNNAGVRLWATYYGGAAEDIACSISTDLNGNVFATGTTTSSNFPRLNPGGGAYYQVSYGGNEDVFILKFNNTGTRLWATFYGWVLAETIAEFDALDIDDCGNLYIGFTSAYLTTVNSGSCNYLDATIGGTHDNFITKFTNSGIRSWASYLGGDGSNDFRCAVAVNSDNDLILVGEFPNYVNSSTLPMVDAGTYFDNTPAGSDDGYIVKFVDTLVLTSSQVNDPNCLCVGSATVTTSCGSPPYSYTWSNGTTVANTLNSTSTITGLCPGNYTAVVSSGCNEIDSVQFVISGVCPFSIALNTDTLCLGECVDLQATPSNASGAVTYVWDNGIGTTGPGPISLCPTTTTTYTVTATNGGDVSTASTTIVVHSFPIVNLGNDTLLCNGTSLVLNAQNPGSNYTWQDGSTNQTLSVSTAGTYWVTVANGSCSSTDTIVVSYTSPIVNLGPDVNSCNLALTLNAQNNGSTYVWQDSSTNQTFNTSSAGAYWVEVTDANGCSSSDTIVLSLLSISVDLGNDTLLCNGASLILDAQNSGSNYTWQDASSNQTLTVSTAGTYWVNVVDNLCSDTDSINVSFNSPIVNLGPDVTSCNLALTLDAQNSGSTYVWQDGSTYQTFNTTTAGTYWVDVTDVNGCSTSDTIVLSLASISVDLGNDTLLCNGASLILDAQNSGSNYTWQDASSNQTLTVSTAGTYWVTVVDNLCSDSDSINVNFNSPIVDLGSDITSCDLALTLDAQNNGSTYAWQDGSTNQTFNTTSAGTYWVEVTDAIGCTTSDTIILSLASISVNLGNDTLLCNGTTLVLNAQNSGSNYTWQDASSNQILTVSTAGTYWVTVVNNLCSDSDSINVNFSSPIVNLGSDITSCDLALTLDAQNNGSTYVWQDSSTNQTFNTSSAGAYWVDVTDANGCSSSDTIVLSLSSITVNLGNDTLVCNGASLILDAQNTGANYTWQDASSNQILTVSTAGTYWVTVVNNLCSDSDSINVNFSSPIVNLGSDITSCDLALTLDAQNNGSTYVWQDSSTNQTFNTSSAGAYWVDVTDANGCSSSDTIVLSLSSISVDLGNDTILCTGASLVLDAQNTGANYTWQDGSTNQTFTVSAPGSYWVTINDGFGCTNSDTILVDFSVPVALFNVADTTGCSPLTVSFTDLSTTDQETIVQWNWNFGDNSTSTLQHPTHIYASSDIYSVTLTVTNSLGCTDTRTQDVIVTVYDQPIAAFTYNPVPAIVDQEVYFVDQSINATSWWWEFGDNSTSTAQNPVYTYGSPNEFSAMLVASNVMCTDTAIAYISIEEELIYYIPNTFTPDGNQFNQTFQPVFTNGFDPYDFNMLIFNRWGEIIFESNDPTLGWDGKTKDDRTVQDGTYTWKIEFKELNSDKRHSIVGHVTLMK